jgi:hypothetical protein
MTTITGDRLLQWAVSKCKEKGYPPTDSTMILMIRQYFTDTDFQQWANPKQARQATRGIKTEGID